METMLINKYHRDIVAEQKRVPTKIIQIHIIENKIQV